MTDRDDLLTIALDAAHDDLEADCGRRFYLDASPSPMEYEADGSGLLLVDDIGDLTGLVVETGYGTSWTPVATTGFRPGPANALARGRAITSLALTGGAIWPDFYIDTTTIVRVTARWGWPTVPPRVKQACLLQASRLYARRKSPQGVVGSADFGQIRVSRLDPDVFKLVSQLVKPGFA